MLDQRLRRWPTLYKCYANALCLLGSTFFLNIDNPSTAGAVHIRFLHFYNTLHISF